MNLTKEKNKKWHDGLFEDFEEKGLLACAIAFSIVLCMFVLALIYIFTGTVGVIVVVSIVVISYIIAHLYEGRFK